MNYTDATPGLVVQCQGGDPKGWYDMMNKTGRLYLVQRVDHHADGGRCIWVSPWSRGTRRTLKSGRIDGNAAGFDKGIMEPIGNGADYEPYPCPADYAGEALPCLRTLETAAP